MPVYCYDSQYAVLLVTMRALCLVDAGVPAHGPKAGGRASDVIMWTTGRLPLIRPQAAPRRTMGSNCDIWAGPATSRPHGCLLAAGTDILGHPSGRALALVAFASWLVTEALGAYMLRSWIISGSARQRRSHPDAISVPVLAGHAGLAFSGFVCWVIFLTTTSPVAAWIALVFLTPAIGLGISTVTVWTPYPVRRRREGPGRHADQRRDVGHAHRHQGNEAASRSIPDDLLASALADEDLTGQLVDRLLAANLEQPGPPRLDYRPLIPVAHGTMAIVTFLLVTLTAIGAS